MNLLKIWLIPSDSPAEKDDVILFERIGPAIMYHVVDIEESIDSIMETVDNLIYSTISTVAIPSRA